VAGEARLGLVARAPSGMVHWLALAAPAAGGPSGLGVLFSFLQTNNNRDGGDRQLDTQQTNFPPMCAPIYPAGT